MSLINTIRSTMKQEGFSGFSPSLEEQLKSDQVFLYWRKDVSGGNGQAYLICKSSLMVEPKPGDVQVDGWHLYDFISYLQNTLIPDLQDSGETETVKDFQTAINFIKEL